MNFKGPEIRNLRQRLGWSLAEMARRMGCGTETIAKWETEALVPDADALNQLSYLRNYVEVSSDQTAQRPIVEKEMEARALAQLTHRDLLKDIQ